MKREYKKSLSNRTKLGRLQNAGNMEEFKNYVLHSGIIIFDNEYEITENKYNSPIMSEKEGMHRKQTILVDGILAEIHMRNGEMIGMGRKIVREEDEIFIDKVLNSKGCRPIK